MLSEGAQEQEGDSHHQGDDLFVAISRGQFPRAIEDYVAVFFMEASCNEVFYLLIVTTYIILLDTGEYLW